MTHEDRTVGFAGFDGAPPWEWPVVATWAFFLAAVALLVVSSRRGVGSATVAGVVVIAGAYLLRRQQRGARATATPHERRRRLQVALAMALVGVVVVAAWTRGGHPNGWALAGLGATLFGSGQALAELRHLAGGRGWRGPVATGVCGALAALGVVVLRVDPVAGIWMIATGVYLAPVGLYLLTQDLAPDLAPGPPPSLLAGAAGPVLGALWLWALGVPLAYALAIAVGLALLVVTVVTDTRIDVAVVLTVAAVMWVAVSREVPPSPAVSPARGDRVIVALGDSFMSGEGARRYFTGTNTKGVNECRRSDTAYAATVGRAVPALADSVLFVACSGATGADVRERAQFAGEPPDGPARDQLDNATATIARLDLTPTLVIVGIGGNDAGFGDIARTCVGAGDCSELGQAWLDRLAGPVRAELDETFSAVDQAFPATPVLVVPYPVPIGPSTCDWVTLSESERRFVVGFTVELDDVERRAAQAQGLYYLGEMRRALDGRRLCDGEAGRTGMNFFAANPTNGASEQTLNPLNWLHNSMHPNAYGHEAMRDTLARWIAAHADAAARTRVAPGAGRVRAATELMAGGPYEPCRSDDPDYCRPETGHWLLHETSNLLLRAAPALGAMIIGAWLVCLYVMATWRGRAAGAAGPTPAGRKVPPARQPVG